MQPQCTFSTQYIVEVTSATESQNKTINKGFIESHHHFPPYEEKSSSPADEGENVSHVSETPPLSPSLLPMKQQLLRKKPKVPKYKM